MSSRPALVTLASLASLHGSRLPLQCVPLSTRISKCVRGSFPSFKGLRLPCILLARPRNPDSSDAPRPINSLPSKDFRARLFLFLAWACGKTHGANLPGICTIRLSLSRPGAEKLERCVCSILSHCSRGHARSRIACRPPPVPRIHAFPFCQLALVSHLPT